MATSIVEEQKVTTLPPVVNNDQAEAVDLNAAIQCQAAAKKEE